MNMLTQSTLSVLAAVTLAMNAHGASRIYVSATAGDDAYPGNELQPKRTLAHAIDAVDAGGEVIILDNGSYGQTRINKGVTIRTAEGVYAAVRGNPAVIVEAIGASVSLQGLTIRGDGDSSTGILITETGLLNVQNCTVEDTGTGILLNARGRLFVKDSILRENSFAAVQLRGGRASIDRVQIQSGGHGLVSQFAGATISNSVISGNNGTGVLTIDGSAVTVESTQVTDSAQDGIAVSSAGVPAVVRVSNSTVSDNFGGGMVAGEGGSIETRGNNTIRGNAVDVTGPVLMLFGQ